jgi:diadenosine tetraphosphate (Ap4A) HIT family hydrolase
MNRCDLCEGDGGEPIWRNEHLRVIRVLGNEGEMYPGFCRVIWNAHVREMTDLAATQRSEIMRVVMKVEQALRDTLRPEKINLASLGNMTPHVHWHVIPRFVDDASYPNPIWVKSGAEVKSVIAAPAQTVAVSVWMEAVKQALSSL